VNVGKDGPDNVNGADDIDQMQNDELVQEQGQDGVPVDAQAQTQAGSDNLAAEYLDALQRERAAFINYRRRTDQERAETVQYASANLLKKLLPIVDDFDRALAAIPEDERKKNKWVAGVELISRKLHTVMEQEGVEPIGAAGQPFDPNLHEAVAFEDNAEAGNDKHEDTVSEVFSKGYKLRDRVLRPAMVKVTRG
jgi:molecular chaperone GrpE